MRAPAPENLKRLAWYLPHQAWCLALYGYCRHDPESAEQVRADLRSLRAADLHGAYLRGANLHGANLRYAYLRDTDLSGANLRDADLLGAYLGGANLHDADLSGASLGGANLNGASLNGAYLSGANLGGSALDPQAPIPPITDDQIEQAGLRAEVVGGAEWLIGSRSRRSRHVGSTDYSDPGEYRAPWFSVDQHTQCHPGIYLGGSPNEWGGDVVEARCLRGDALFISARKGIRCRVLVRLED